MPAPTANILGGFWMSQNWIAPSGYIALGASPPASGAIRVDAASYSDLVLHSINSTRVVQLQNGSSYGAAIGTFSAHTFNLFSNSLSKWAVIADASGTSSFQSNSATARLVGGATNGLAIRNSANTRDNFVVNDAGNQITLSDGTRFAVVSLAGAAGEITDGVRYRGTGGIWVNESSGNAGNKIGIAYWDGTIYRSALETANVASGFSTLALMKSGGAVTIGTDPGGSNTLRVAGYIAAGSGYTISSKMVLKASSDGIIIFSNAAETDIARICLGGTTNAFPSLKRSSSSIQCRLADDSGPADFTAKVLTASGTGGRLFLEGAATSASAGVVSLGNATQTTVGAAGAASALPANPTGYLRFFIGATEYVLPYYAQA